MDYLYFGLMSSRFYCLTALSLKQEKRDVGDDHSTCVAWNISFTFIFYFNSLHEEDMKSTFLQLFRVTQITNRICIFWRALVLAILWYCFLPLSPSPPSSFLSLRHANTNSVIWPRLRQKKKLQEWQLA